MSSLGEVQRIIGLSLNKIQMGRNQRGGLPLHKNLLVATVLNKARDVYMQETMYMNYRLMACGQFSQEGHEDLEEDDTPEAEDYEEDSESDVEDDAENGLKKDYVAQNIIPGVTGATSTPPTPSSSPSSSPAGGSSGNSLQSPALDQSCEQASSGGKSTSNNNTNNNQSVPASTTTTTTNNDEGFIDESDCDCDTRNFCQDSENRVPFQYCFNCAPFHPSNGRGPTLVSPPTSSACVPPQPVSQEQEDKLIYDMDSKSTRNQPGQQSPVKRKRHISLEETQDAITSILPKKMKESENSGEADELNDSGYQEENEMFHPAFRGHNGNNGMEVEQITSLVSIFSFGQQLFNSSQESAASAAANTSTSSSKGSKKGKEDEDSDSDSDTSSDSGHSSDDQNNADDKVEEGGSRDGLLARMNGVDQLRCGSQLKEGGGEMDVPAVGVPTVV